MVDDRRGRGLGVIDGPSVALEILLGKQRGERAEVHPAQVHVPAKLKPGRPAQRRETLRIDVEGQRRVARFGIAVDLGLGIIERDDRSGTKPAERH